MIKKFLFGVLLFVVVLAGALILFSKQDRKKGNGLTSHGLELPIYSGVNIDFNHSFVGDKMLPFMGAAIIDYNNDGIEEIFLGGGVRQNDALFSLKEGQFRNITEAVGLVKLGGEATYGVAVLDVDSNGFDDLIISRDSGVWLYSNNEGSFSGRNLEIPLARNSVPLSIALCDLNKDGYFDMYITGHTKRSLLPPLFLFQELEEKGQGGLFINNGDDTFYDITSPSGLGEMKNGIQGLFVDIDGNGYEDLVATRRGDSVVIWKNRGNLTFEPIATPNSSEKSYPAGIGVGDVNQDGLTDLFFTNIGSTLPPFLGQKIGDVNTDFNPQWLVYKNRDQFQFEDVSRKMRVDAYQFSQGALLQDLNLDGREDLVVSANSPEWPMHRFPQLRLFDLVFLQTPQAEFAEISGQSGLISQGLGGVPLTADFNGDGVPDLIFTNLGGKPQAYISKKSGNNFLKVKLPNRLESIGADVVVETLGGKTLHKQFISGEGLCSDQSHVLIFGLEKDVAVSIVATFPGREPQRVDGEIYNATVDF